mmetsp:Transcript_28911/g.75823  ORF Transcript_28911/g.75823 Transcript_28911/m.75823 type:complete len:238 (-) Transcript_28911:1310-2023(-)
MFWVDDCVTQAMPVHQGDPGLGRVLHQPRGQGVQEHRRWRTARGLGSQLGCLHLRPREICQAVAHNRPRVEPSRWRRQGCQAGGPEAGGPEAGSRSSRSFWRRQGQPHGRAQPRRSHHLGPQESREVANDPQEPCAAEHLQGPRQGVRRRLGRQPVSQVWRRRQVRRGRTRGQAAGAQAGGPQVGLLIPRRQQEHRHRGQVSQPVALCLPLHRLCDPSQGQDQQHHARWLQENGHRV